MITGVAIGTYFVLVYKLVLLVNTIHIQDRIKQSFINNIFVNSGCKITFSNLYLQVMTINLMVFTIFETQIAVTGYGSKQIFSLFIL